MFTRQKKLPDPKKYMMDDAPKNAVQRIDENAIMARMKAYQHDRDKAKGTT